MTGRSLFLGGVLGVAALAAGVRYARAPAPPAALKIAAADFPSEHPARVAGARAPGQARVVVYVAGEVAHPGVYRLAASGRAESALRAAGGATGNADLVAVNLAQPLRDGEEIAVPARGAAPGMPRRKRSARTPRLRKSDAARQEVDLNTADEEQLQTLPGIGASLAARITAFRRLNGPFQTLDDMRDVGGMTDGKVDRIAPYVRLP